MEEQAIREKRRIKILERMKKESNLNDEFKEAEIQETKINSERNLSASEKYNLLKKSESKQVNK